MAKNFKKLSDEVRSSPARAGRVDEHKAAIADSLGLGDLRSRRGETQVTVAGTLGVTQGRVSSLERQHDVYLSTLGGYVEALGGRLEVRAVFDDETVDLIPHPVRPAA